MVSAIESRTKEHLVNLLNDPGNHIEKHGGRDSAVEVELEALGSWPESPYRINTKSVHAIVAAVAANRPLLLKGEPGVGKSHLARAAAKLLRRHFFSTVVQPHSEYQELMWTIDHTRRLADAQLQAALFAQRKNAQNYSLKRLEQKLDLKNYLSPGPLWWAYDWSHAKAQRCHSDYHPEDEGAFKAEKSGVVLLIDEIDKADLALANGLLEVLGNGGFSVPYLNESIRNDEQPPLVVITSNDTRELPKAFIRRCVVHTLALPEGKALEDYFVDIGHTHVGDRIDKAIILQAAKSIIRHRDSQTDRSQARTGLAEFVDLLHAINHLGGEDPQGVCDALAGFFHKGE